MWYVSAPVRLVLVLLVLLGPGLFLGLLLLGILPVWLIGCLLYLCTLVLHASEHACTTEVLEGDC